MLIGITGDFGSGKTTVAKMFEKLGSYNIDADKVCHSLMKPSGKLYKKIIRRFGANILKKNRAIDRRKLGKIVFKDSSKLESLNKLMHPEAIRKIKKIIRSKKKAGVIAVDAALLVESGFYKEMDCVVVVKSKRDNMIDRSIRTKGLRRSETFKRIRSQAPIKEKIALADFIIDNSGTKKETFLQVKKIWKKTGACYAGK